MYVFQDILDLLSGLDLSATAPSPAAPAASVMNNNLPPQPASLLLDGLFASTTPAPLATPQGTH